MVSMNHVGLYRTFSQEFFYSFQKHSTDLELEELGRRYSAWLDRNGRIVNAILSGGKQPDELRDEVRRELESLARAEAKFANELPQDIQGAHFESETGFSRLDGKLRRLVEGRSHLVRLVKPSEYDKNYWFYAGSDDPPQHVFCSEFGLDMIEYLQAVRNTNKVKLKNLRKAIACRIEDVCQFWALAPYVHHSFMELGYAWSTSIATVLKIAGKRFAREGRPFAGRAKFPLGYDERMPTHLLARMEAMRDAGCLKRGEYTSQYGIELPDRLARSP
jgi:hypothetical protein